MRTSEEIFREAAETMGGGFLELETSHRQFIFVSANSLLGMLTDHEERAHISITRLKSKAPIDEEFKIVIIIWRGRYFYTGMASAPTKMIALTKCISQITKRYQRMHGDEEMVGII